ncbi:MAG TPA: leucyl aminopeptidase family protein [Pseudomonadales bacterium]
MSLISLHDGPRTSIALIPTAGFDDWLKAQPPLSRVWIDRQQFKAKTGQFAWLPDDGGAPDSVVAGWDGKDPLDALGSLPFGLPEGVYELATPASALQLIGWGLGAYQFDRYRAAERQPAELVLPSSADAEAIGNEVAAVRLVRDLINVPADEMNPTRLAEEAVQLADSYSAEVSVIVGDDLLNRGFNTIHAVGRAASDSPRLVDIRWGDPSHPKLSLIGKGVCFDSGGLDIKPASAMRTMKKDMGGAANVLGLAQLIMSAGLPVRLRVLIPAVENAISGNAYRPGDIIQTYKGISVEIDNTDAEGRLVMCDALALAAEEEPALILDYSTLTGAARTAVGAEIAAMFANDNALAAGIGRCGEAMSDPVWRLPLHAPYDYLLKSNVADTVNSASVPYGGAITAALFLEKFVGTTSWAHFDIMAYNIRPRPGRPEGGEAMGIRATFHYLKERFGG